MQPPDQFGSQIDKIIDSHDAELISLRRDLHANPELSHSEFDTTARLASRLDELGFEVHVREEATGFYADLTPADFDAGADPTVAIRTDIDALPIDELNEVPYASKSSGVMHACGHDVHMTVATGAGMAMTEIREHLDGRLRLVYQHAEEVSPGGAVEMVSFGALDDVDAILALHCNPEIEVGRIGLRPGHLTAAFDRFHVKVIGKSGHGARPHHCVDPVRVATQLANALYQLPGQYFDTRDPVVLTVGSIHAGDSANVIPAEATIEGTIRTLSREARAEVEPLLKKVIGGTCMSHGASFELEVEHGAPSVFNEANVVDTIDSVGRQVLGEDGIYDIPLPSMGGEDFAVYLQHVPGAMFRLGTAGPGRRARHYLHSAQFDVDERAIGLGARILSKSALELMSKLGNDQVTLQRPRSVQTADHIGEEPCPR